MIDYIGIKEKVRKLENDAHDIENMMEEFFYTDSTIEKFGSVEWMPPEGDLQILHEQLILIYESWYNQCHMLIQSYYPKKEEEFRLLHDNIEKNDERPVFKGHKLIKYGISDIIQLKAPWYPGATKERVITDLKGSFKKQLAIIIALPEVLHLCNIDDEKSENDLQKKENFM